jgi:hypothetical protein
MVAHDEDLQQEGNRLANRVREQLWRYYPQALQIGEDLAADWFLELWAAVPTPAKAARIRESTVSRILKAHRIRRITAAEVLRILRQPALVVAAGIATLASMMEEDAALLCGPRYGGAEGKVGFHGGKVAIERPRVRARDGGEVALPSWETARSEDLFGKWALNLMLIDVLTRRFGRAVRLPEGDLSAAKGTGVSKSAVSRRFVAAERMAAWMAADLSELDLLIIQIDGIHIARGPHAAGRSRDRR